MEDTDILTLGWGCEPGPPPLWPSSEEFVTLDMDSCSSGGESQDYVTLEVCKERDREYYNSQLETEKRKVKNGICIGRGYLESRLVVWPAV